MLFSIIRSDRYLMPDTNAPCIAIKHGDDVDFSKEHTQSKFLNYVKNMAGSMFPTDSFELKKGIIFNQFILFGKHGSITVSFRPTHKYINLIVAPAYIDILSKVVQQ